MKFFEIVKDDLCNGCGMCAGIYPEYIKMEYNKDGNLRPIIIKEMTDEIDKEIMIFCSGATLKYQNRIGNTDVIWGDIKKSYTGFSTNEDIRFKASSGGGITGLLIYMLENKIIDGVIHTGVGEKPLENVIKVSCTKEEIINNCGSRYAPSSPLSNIKQYINNDKKYAFVGKPCDVASLRMYLNENKNVKNIVVLLSFMCAGAPSIKGTEKILEKFDVKSQDVEIFRYRGNGWPGLTYIKTKDNKEYTMKYDDSWGKILNKYLQHRCKVCPDGIGEFADIVCADAWYGDNKGYPSFEEKQGRSLIIGRTELGERIIEDAQKSESINVEKFDLEDLEIIQPFQAQRKKLVFSRLLALKVIGVSVPKYINMNIIKASFKIDILRNLKSFIGMAKRGLKKKYD